MIDSTRRREVEVEVRQFEGVRSLVVWGGDKGAVRQSQLPDCGAAGNKLVCTAALHTQRLSG
jgi:hypothetical protein